MDCPNCGAYNASNAHRCRRCNQVLPAARGERRDEPVDDAGGSASPLDRGSSTGDTAWDVPPPDDYERDRRDRDTTDRDPDWGRSSEEHLQRDPWTTEQPGQHDPWRTEQSGSGSQPGAGQEAFGTPGGGMQYGPPPDIPNYLWQSIAVTLCCCWPAGIPAIVFAARVNGFTASGDYQQAQENSDKAKMWTIIALVLGLLAYVAFICIALTSD